MDDQNTSQKSFELSPLAQFLIVVCAGIGSIYGASRGHGGLNMTAVFSAGFVIAIVAVFLIVNRKK
jgi:hypothetical protein